MNDTLVILLCKKQKKYVKSLQDYLQNFVETIVCEENLSIPKNYVGLNRIKKNPMLPIAWENAFFILFNSHLYNRYKFVYFIEDDVYSKNFQTFLNLIDLHSNHTEDLIASDIGSRIDQPGWYWWKDKDVIKYYQQLKSFNPLCRLSNKLINYVEKFFLENNQFCFHETLFASLAINNNLKILYYKKDDNPYISTIRWRPVFKLSDITDDKIYHPVKSVL